MAQIVVNYLAPLLSAKLTSRSQRHHRSLNDELLAILENAVHAEGSDSKASTLAPEEKLARARAVEFLLSSSRLLREERER